MLLAASCWTLGFASYVVVLTVSDFAPSRWETRLIREVFDLRHRLRGRLRA
jgi:hypothetical protein